MQPLFIVISVERWIRSCCTCWSWYARCPWSCPRIDWTSSRCWWTCPRNDVAPRTCRCCTTNGIWSWYAPRRYAPTRHPPTRIPPYGYGATSRHARYGTASWLPSRYGPSSRFPSRYAPGWPSSRFPPRLPSRPSPRVCIFCTLMT